MSSAKALQMAPLMGSPMGSMPPPMGTPTGSMTPQAQADALKFAADYQTQERERARAANASSASNPNSGRVESVVIVSDTNYTGRYIYSTFHSIMALIAIYLSFKCNKGFDLGSFMLACCCPYIYIIYTLATKGTCGILGNESASTFTGTAAQVPNIR